MRVVNYFEDDYGNIEFVPLENRSWVTDQLRRIDEFSDQHRSGIGWSAVYARAEVPAPLETKHIPLAEVHRVLANNLPRFDRITYERSPVSDDSRSVAYGCDSGVAIFVESEDDTVKEIWAILQPTQEGHVEVTAGALAALNQWDLALVDWGWSRLIPLSDSEALTEYMHERLRVFGVRTQQDSASATRGLWSRFRSWLGGA